jgi:hypothetical protein
MARKPHKEPVHEGPGPGTYKLEKFNVGKSKSTIVIGNEPRLPEDLSSTKAVPGPGSYKTKLAKTNVGAKIGTEPRLPGDKTT